MGSEAIPGKGGNSLEDHVSSHGPNNPYYSPLLDFSAMRLKIGSWQLPQKAFRTVAVAGAAALLAATILSPVNRNSYPLQPGQAGGAQQYLNGAQQQNGTYDPTQPSSQTGTSNEPASLEALTEQQVRVLFEELLVKRKITTAADFDTYERIGQLADAVHFLLTGKTFKEDGLEFRYLTMQQRDELSDELRKTPERRIGWNAFPYLKDDGTIVITYTFPPRDLPLHMRGVVEDVFNEVGVAYAAEKGIMRSAINNKNREAIWAKQSLIIKLYAAAAVNRMKEAGVKEIASYPTTTGEDIEHAYNVMLGVEGVGELLAQTWRLALDDPEAGRNLEERGWAGSAPLMQLIDQVALQPDDKFLAWRETAVKERYSLIPQIREAVLQRIVPNLRFYPWSPSLP